MDAGESPPALCGTPTKSRESSINLEPLNCTFDSKIPDGGSENNLKTSCEYGAKPPPLEELDRRETERRLELEGGEKKWQRLERDVTKGDDA